MEAVPSYSDHPWIRFYEAGIPAHLEYPDITLGEVMSRTVSKYPDHTALLFFGKKISYGQLDALVNRFAHALVGLGVKKGDRVALMLPNIPQMVIAYYGTLRMGAIAVATNPLYHEHELEVQLKDSGAETLVAVDMFHPIIAHALSKTGVKELILCGIKDYLPFPLNLLYPIKAKIEKQWVRVKRVPPIYDFLVPARARPRQHPVNVDCFSRRHCHFAVYRRYDRRTPKGAILTHRNLVANAGISRAWLTLRE